METLIIHIPQLYEKRHLFNENMKRNAAWGTIHEKNNSGGFIAPETFLTSDRKVLIANYKLDELTVLMDGNGKIIQQLLENQIDFEPREIAFLTERPDKSKSPTRT